MPYLLLPRHKRLFDAARKRISTIRRYSSLGAGFKVALRDLEIRGAGNLLGSQQCPVTFPPSALIYTASCSDALWPPNRANPCPPPFTWK